jgi:acyl-activating enzyme 14
LEALLAVSAAGCIAAPLNWRWGAAEAAHAAGLVGASGIIADSACAALAAEVAAACPRCSSLVLLGTCSESAAPSSGALSAPPGVRAVFAEALIAEHTAAARHSLVPRWAPDDAALAVFTSGTTGRPRAALLSHGAMHFQCQTKLRCCGYARGDVYLHAAPLFHVGGLCSALAMLLAGAAHVFLPRFSAPAALAAIEQYAVTSFIAVPTTAADLVAAAAPGQGAPGPASLLCACCSGFIAACP